MSLEVLLVFFISAFFEQFVMTGIVLMTFSDSKGFDGFVPGAACIGLGLLTKHSKAFYIINL